MNSIIKCKTNQRGKHEFYLECKGKEYYMFSQDYHRGVNILFANGVSIHNALKYKTAKRDHCAVKTISKMKSCIKYIEKEYGLVLLNNTSKKEYFRKKQ